MKDKFSTLKTLFEKVKQSIDIKNAYGKTVEDNGVKIIPVAESMVAGGGGGGKSIKGIKEIKKIEDLSSDLANPEEGENGIGLGFYAKNSPVGYLKIKNGEVKFEKLNRNEGVRFLLALSLVFLIIFVGTKKILSKIKEIEIDND